MKSAIICFFVFVFFSKIYSQDTVYYNDKSKTAALVKKITPSEIEFLKFNNPNGLVIVEKKTLIKYIRYQDGSIDSIRKYPLPLATHYFEFENFNNKLYLDRNMFIYKYAPISHFNLNVLFNTYPFEITKNVLNLKFRQMKKQRNLSSVFAISAVISGSALWLGLSAGNRGKPLLKEEIIYLCSSTALLGGSILFYINFHRKDIKTKKEIVKIYNEMK